MLFSIIDNTLTVFPDDNEIFEFGTYSDGSDGGNTEISNAASEDGNLAFSFTLKKQHAYPYAGLSINLNNGDELLNLSRFDYLTLDITSVNAKSFTIFLKTFIDSFTKMDEHFTHEFLMKEISLDTIATQHTIKFKEFIHPQWWLEQSKITEDKIGNPNFSKAISLQVQNGVLTPFDTTVHVSLSRISFGTDNSNQYYLTGILLAVYFTIYFLLFFVIKKFKIHEAKQVIIPYKQLEVENDFDEDLKRITNCIANNYSESAFNVEKLAREAGVSASKIPGMLKKKYSLNFKQYLNKIRISEAKRLLIETDNQIVTLAYTVGYNNIPHFNRTFKQSENISPKEYRKNNKDLEKDA